MTHPVTARAVRRRLPAPELASVYVFVTTLAAFRRRLERHLGVTHFRVARPVTVPAAQDRVRALQAESRERMIVGLQVMPRPHTVAVLAQVLAGRQRGLRRGRKLARVR